MGDLSDRMCGEYSERITTPVSSFPSDELLTITEACAFLKIKRRTIDDWRAAKAIPCVERGRWIRFRRSDLEAFITAHTTAKAEGRAA